MKKKIIAKLENISKQFPGVLALDRVNFDLRKGECHVLLGENGAGKSTLINILGGVIKPTSGKIFIKDKEYDFLTPHVAQDLGIRIIHQELNLVPGLTVAENIFLGNLPQGGPLRSVNWPKVFSSAQAILNNFGINIDARALVRDLEIAKQQMVEIARAISFDADIIIMDEPTSALTLKEVEELFKIINDLKTRGVSIIYISHRLEEVNIVGDRVTVLKDGKLVKTLDSTTHDISEYVNLMVGRELSEKYIQEGKYGYTPIKNEKVLEIKNLTKKGLVKNVSFTLHKGEILGLSGLVGAGRTEIAKTIFGAWKKDSGSVSLNGKKLFIQSPLSAIKNGLGYVPENRREEGLIINFPIWKNITLPLLEKQSTFKGLGGLVNIKKEKDISKRAIRDLNIKASNIEELVAYLSGGNQQKVVIAKWLYTDVKVLILDEPTRGIDVGAKSELYKLIRKFAHEGISIIIISSELPELLLLTDRILVVYEGKIVDEFLRDEYDEEDIIYAATTGKRKRRKEREDEL